MAQILLEQTFLGLPFLTRTYLAACTLTSLAVELRLVSPFALYFNPTLIFRGQVWRLLTAFTYFGPLGFTFLFNMLFTVRYCRMLEEGSFLGRTADFVWMFIFGAVLTAIADLFLDLLFLGQAFTSILVYVWARRNPHFRLNLFGIMDFQASYLPLVLFSLSLVMDNGWVIDLVGITIGHTYYFLEDVFPRQPNGFKVIRTPMWLKRLCDEVDEEVGEEIPLDDFPRAQRPEEVDRDGN